MPSDNVLPNLAGLALVKSSEQNFVQASCVYDSAAGIGDDVDTSYAATFAPMFQVNAVPTGTIVAVEAKIHKDADWHEIWRSTDLDPHFITTYQMPYNFIRARRVSGTGDVKAFASVMPTDNMG